jgi:hypothetical protein
MMYILCLSLNMGRTVFFIGIIGCTCVLLVYALLVYALLVYALLVYALLDVRTVE